MEEMLRLADEPSGGAETDTRPACDNGIEGDYDCDGNVSMEEMMRLADENADGADEAVEVLDEDAGAAPAVP
jgi:hypothetical protein